MSLYPRVERFESVSIILPVINETFSLRQTVDTILRDVRREDLREFLIVVCGRTTAESRRVIDRIQNDFGELVAVLEQRLPFWGGAIRDGFATARASHVVMMSSDLETDPGDIRRMMDQARRQPAGVVVASRWMPGGAFHGYSAPKLACNWLFQRCFSLLFLTRLSDLTFGFRLLPVQLVRAIRWEEVRHCFSLECLLKPLRLGVPISEIPTVWRARPEGESQNPFLRNFEFFRTGLKIRLARKETFLLDSGDSSSRRTSGSISPGL